MRHDWIADILAVIETGSFARAATLRNISQSAFTRRIDTIEAQVGGRLFDRHRKPVVLSESMHGLEHALRRTLMQQTQMLQELRSLASGGAAITVACQHALSATLSPQIVRTLTEAGLHPVRVRSGNQDACQVMLWSGEADLLIGYARSPSRPEHASGFAQHSIGAEALVPVARPDLLRRRPGGLPIVSYPPDVFFGQLQAEILAGLPTDVTVTPIVETALTLAAYRYAVDGFAVAWLPVALVGDDLAAGRLQRVGGLGPDLALNVIMMRSTLATREVVDRGWQAIQQGLEGLP